MTRRLIATGQRPVTVGTWFSLGHSTFVSMLAFISIKMHSRSLRSSQHCRHYLHRCCGNCRLSVVQIRCVWGNRWYRWQLRELRILDPSWGNECLHSIPLNHADVASPELAPGRGRAGLAGRRRRLPVQRPQENVQSHQSVRSLPQFVSRSLGIWV